MKKRYLAIFSIAVFIFHSTLLQFFRIGGIIPNVSLIFIVVFSAIFEEKEGLGIALLLGIFQDLFLMKVFGINIIIYFIIAYIISSLEESLFKDNFITPITFIFLATIFYYLFMFCFLYFLGDNVAFFKLLLISLKESLYNCVLGIFIYSLFLKRIHGFSLR